MRLPVSTIGDEGLCGEVFVCVVRKVVLPCAPEDSEPRTCEDAHGMGMPAAAQTSLSINVCGPRAGMAGVVGEAGDGGAQPLVAGPSPSDASGFAALIGDGRDTGLRGEMVFALEAGPHVAEFGGDLGGADLSGAREGHDDAPLRQLDISKNLVFEAGA